MIVKLYLSKFVKVTRYAAVFLCCCGDVIWWPRTRLKTEHTQPSHVQRLACLSMTGAMKTTPTSAMQATLWLPPLDLYVEELAIGAALRLTSVWIFGPGVEHSGILGEAFMRQPLLAAMSDHMSPEYKSGTHYVVNPKSTITAEPLVEIFTDGSKNREGTGCGVYSPEIALKDTFSWTNFKLICGVASAAIIGGCDTITCHLISSRISRRRILRTKVSHLIATVDN